MCRCKFRNAFSIIELLVVIGVAAIALAVALPAAQHTRAKARRIQCALRLSELSIATNIHLSTYNTFPYTSKNFGVFVNGSAKRFPAISPHSQLLASLDQAAFEKVAIFDPSLSWTDRQPISTVESNRILIKTSMPMFLCPSDSGPVGGNNYRANLGPDIGVFRGSPPTTHNGIGAFENGRALSPSSFSDGLSNTIMYSEKVIGDRNRTVYQAFRDNFVFSPGFTNRDEAARTCRQFATSTPLSHDSFGGTTWLFGGYNHTWYNHVATPNSFIPDCCTGLSFGGGDGLYTARSLHHGGVNVGMADGSTNFISNSIDALVWLQQSTRSSGD
ncbi:hypothetical protein CA51_08260 [Rosistilla oblonga]|uniref:DUF1559 domain-containing protein n=1 Tax=Rosistilla oblonga TaxID=2527990 RepID=A0A518INI7_9BACT|nr:hypothetical protein CA51_08260 [Rosistilla oblonga]QDV54663.1 hypothetical protein Mal33_06180 [Rosistilla oblonga]